MCVLHSSGFSSFMCGSDGSKSLEPFCIIDTFPLPIHFISHLNPVQLPCRWRQHYFLKCWDVFTVLYSVILQGCHLNVDTLSVWHINPLNAKLNPICHLLALLGAHHIFQISRVRVKSQVSVLLNLNSDCGTLFPFG